MVLKVLLKIKNLGNLSESSDLLFKSSEVSVCPLCLHTQTDPHSVVPHHG